jgi:hypothetical protein
MTKKQKNRRRKPMTRTEMGNCQGFVVKGSARIEVEIADQDHGGIGIIVPKGMILNLRDELKVEFPLTPGIEYIEIFKVVEINGDRVGLQYSDKSSMSPKQRWDTWMVKIKKQKEKRSRRAAKAPPSKGFVRIVYSIKKMLKC